MQPRRPVGRCQRLAAAAGLLAMRCLTQQISPQGTIAKLPKRLCRRQLLSDQTHSPGGPKGQAGVSAKRSTLSWLAAVSMVVRRGPWLLPPGQLLGGVVDLGVEGALPQLILCHLLPNLVIPANRKGPDLR